jgi:hypothetical protein
MCIPYQVRPSPRLSTLHAPSINHLTPTRRYPEYAPLLDTSYAPLGTLTFHAAFPEPSSPAPFFLQGNFWQSLPAYFREFGHNFGLHSAAKGGLQRGDDSCAMGACCTNRCFNGPHAWQLDWATPLATLDKDSLPAGGGLSACMGCDSDSQWGSSSMRG